MDGKENRSAGRRPTIALEVFMEKRVDARGLACPQPVLLAREALAGGGEVVVLVDNDTAAENLRRLGAKRGCVVTVERGRGADWQVRLKIGRAHV